MPVIDDEETLILEEESRSKMSEKAKDPESAEQDFWLRMSNPTSKPSDASLVKIEAPKELSKASLLNESLKKLKFHLARFDNVVKIRTTLDACTESEWGFEHTKAVFINEIIPFLKSLKDIFNVFDRDLLNEIMKVHIVFDQIDAAIHLSSVDKQCLEIAKKELLLENDRLLQQIMSQDVLLTVMNSMSLIGESVHMDRKRNESCDKCFNLEAELLKSQNAHNDLLKSYSHLEKHCSSKKAKIVESKNAYHSEPNHTWGSNATDISSSSSLVMTGTVRFGNDHIARIMGYGDYQLGNVTISIVYYVKGLGHNFFSVGQFCDADLEVAFRKNTCFIRNLEGVDLLSGSRDTNLYIISLDDMLKIIFNCLLSKVTTCFAKALISQHFSKGQVDLSLLTSSQDNAGQDFITDTPMVEKSKLDEDLHGNPVDATLYRGIIGSLMYLTSSRPNLIYVVCLCAWYQAKPTKKHLNAICMIAGCVSQDTSCSTSGSAQFLDDELVSWSSKKQKCTAILAKPTEKHLQAVKRIFLYLKGTINMGLWYSKDAGMSLTAYTDADHRGCQDTRRSTSRSTHFLGDKLVSGSSKKYKCTAISSTEAEYIIPLYSDNKSMIALCYNIVQHTRAKHIYVRYHFIKEQVENGVMELYFVRTEYQLADIFTKPLPRERFNFLIEELGKQQYQEFITGDNDEQLSNKEVTKADWFKKPERPLTLDPD
ncbi:hypothetical protein Tco_0736729 [Tanacetum coccineum]